MLKISLPILAVVLSVGVAHGQTVGGNGSDSHPIAAHAGYSPGTIGAMEEVSQGIATNANDVAVQQGSGGMTAGYSAGTVGATPGR